jgi:uncharacterized protein YraI
MIALAAVSGIPVFHPAAVFAASGTVSQETPLYESPDPGAPVIVLLPEGSIVSIDGPPVDGFYPVTAGNQSGWLRGETVQVEKDLAESDADETDETVAGEASAELNPALSTTVDPATDPAVTTSAATEASAPAPVDASAPASAIPVAEVAPVGPASVAVDAPILAGPGPEYGFIATVPAGSTVEQTGHVINGYATVQYAEVTGWLALEQLGTPSTAVEETPSAEIAPVKTLPSADAPLAHASPVEASRIEAASSETPPGETTPSETPPVETAPADSAPVAAS